MEYEGLFPKDKPYLRWHHFKDIGSADKMYEIMNNELFPFIKNLQGDGESSYARFMKDAIFKIPTPNLQTPSQIIQHLLHFLFLLHLIV